MSDLVNAKYTAMGARGEDCNLERFIHVGMDELIVYGQHHPPLYGVHGHGRDQSLWATCPPSEMLRRSALGKGDMSMRTFVVGIDGSPASRSALRLALDEAALRGCGVHAVTCWSDSVKTGTGSDLPPTNSYDRASRIQRKIIFEVATTVEEIHRVVGEIDEGDPGPILVSAARKADGLLVGASSKGALARLTGHEVVEYCVRHATVPVVVVPWTPAELASLDLEAELSHDDDRGAPSFGETRHQSGPRAESPVW